MSSLLIRREGEGDWHEPATTVYGNEQDLQDMLEDSPGLIPGLAEPAAVAAEVYLRGAGYADLLLVEGDGEMTIEVAALDEKRLSALHGEGALSIKRSLFARSGSELGGGGVLDLVPTERVRFTLGGARVARRARAWVGADEPRVALPRAG